MSDSSKLARREFIKVSARMFGAVGFTSAIGNTFVSQIMNRALASAQARHFYIHLSLPGGPPRWYFDLALNPRGVASDFIAGGFGTGLRNAGGGVAEAFYRTTPIELGGRTWNLPWLWSLPRAGRANADLLNHMQMFRGVDMQINNHGLSRQRQVAPILGGVSIGGLLADHSDLPLSSAGNGLALSAFKSHKGKAALAVNLSGSTNPLETILKPFREGQASVLKKEEWERAISTSLDHFDSYAESIGIRPNTLRAAYGDAVALIKADTFQLKERWPEVLRKYKEAMNEALTRSRINQIFSSAVKADGSPQFSCANGEAPLNSPDLRSMFDSGATIAGFAEAFALSEILVSEQISSNLSVDLSPISGLKVGSRLIQATHDQHNYGSAVSVLVNTAFYRAMVNCLHELVRELKSKGLFNQTVIHISSEFNRNPRQDGSGADHGFVGSSSSIISGMINQFGLIGNVFKDGRRNSTNSYVGTWGSAAPFANFGRPIYVQDIANTIAVMLGLTRLPSDNGKILLNAANGWKPLTAEAKNV